MIITRDFHGWTLEDAIQEVHNVIGDVRLNRKQQTVHFITGNGPIRSGVADTLQQYGLFCEAMWGNPGVIIATIT